MTPTHIVDYLVSELQLSNETAVSLIVTISIFSLGIIINELLKAFSRYLERRNTRFVLVHTLNSIVNSGFKGSKYLEDISNKITFEGMGVLEYRKLDFFGSDALLDIGYEQLFNSLMFGPENHLRFLKSFRIKIFSKVWALNRVINSIHKRAYTEIEHLLREYNIKNDIRNKSINRLRKAIFDIQAQLDGKQVNPEIAYYLKELENIYEK